MVRDVEDRTEVGVSQHCPFGLAGSASSVLENCDLILKVAARVALKPAVIVDKRGKFNLTTGSSDAICRWSKGARDRRWQKVLDATQQSAFRI
jgi:hypothetical protein